MYRVIDADGEWVGYTYYETIAGIKSKVTTIDSR